MAPSIDVTVSVTGAPTARRVTGWCGSLLASAPPRNGERRRGSRSVSLSVLLCGDARMRTLNRTWRAIDRPTDVLSFPSDQPGALGDLVIDVPYAARQARRLGHGTDREVKALLAHGLLHLLGYDHETDDGEMFERQRRLVRAAFGPGPDGVPADEP